MYKRLKKIFDKNLKKIKDYFGIGLPNRDLDLNFSLPTPSKRGEKPNTDNRQLLRQFKELLATPSLLLTEIEEYLITLNRYDVTLEDRLIVSNIGLRFFYPIMLNIFNKYRDDGGIPDGKNKVADIEQVEKILTLLIKSYKLIFQHDYNSSRFHYAKNRLRFNFCAMRLLELIYYRQRLLSLRYTLLETSSWLVAHQIYGIMSEYENVTKRYPVLSHHLFKDNNNNTRKVQRKSIEDYYMDIQLYAIIDQLSWHTKALPFIDDYLSCITPSIVPVRYIGGVIAPAEMVVYYGQKEPPHYDTQKKDDEISLAWTFNFTPLLVQLKLDRKALYHANAEKNEFLVPKFLRKILPEYRLPLIEGLETLVVMDSSNYTALGSEPYDDIRIYSGIAEIYDKLKDVFQPHSKNADSRKFRDAMAQHSSALSEDRDGSEESLWFKCDSHSSDTLCLKTIESQYTESYHIGSLVLIEDYSTTPSQLNIAKVTKINRIYKDKYVQFSVKYLGSDALPVTMRSANIKPEDDSKKKVLSGAIMLMTHNKVNSLLIPFSKSYWYNSEVIIFNNNHEIHTFFGDVVDMSQDFYQFSLKNKNIPLK